MMSGTAGSELARRRLPEGKAAPGGLRPLKRCLRFDCADEPERKSRNDHKRSDGKTGNEPRNAPEIIEERATAAREEDAAAHDIEVKESRDGREDANGQSGSWGCNGSGGAMG